MGFSKDTAGSVPFTTPYNELLFYFFVGAFLIPYFIMLAIEGMPIFFLELAIGQRLRKGAIGVWTQVSPYLAGVGIASAFVSFNVALYYNTIISWCLLYFARVSTNYNQFKDTQQTNVLLFYL